MDDDAMESIIKLFIVAILVSIALTVAIFLGGPLLALYTLVKGWLNVTTRVKVGAMGLPLIGAGIATWYVAQGQIMYSDTTVLFLWGALVVSLSMVGIAYLREQQKFSLANLTLPTANAERVCAHCGAANRPGFKYCNVCGRAAISVTHQIKGP
ncbi:MAG: hypothetical protein B6D41_01695 [Chloroflexi bacterium UTCFX4]|jgi:uncharacterized paraquat-inducible protein A|nr:MAG: hypothetical protein B6D41_01695 [Chloroflexi bacterium UTCFX4]